MTEARRVLVLGGNGMLGSMLIDVLGRTTDWRIRVTLRPGCSVPLSRPLDRLDLKNLDAARCTDAELSAIVDGTDHVLNAIGLTKQRIVDTDPTSVDEAVLTNAVFPRRLALACARADATLIQIATDCVFAGDRTAYKEDALHDPTDVYGKTRSLGETGHPEAHHLRCSIIGVERGQARSLLGWFLSQQRGTRVRGFRNHRWNGISTLQFAKICIGVIEHGVQLPSLQHVVPRDSITKQELLEVFKRDFRREDLTIDPFDSPESIDRTLATVRPETNRQLWSAAGYREPPSIRDMVAELAAWTLHRSRSR